MGEFRFEDIENRKTLITGEVGIGKTELTALLLREAISRVGSSEIAVLDFAPSRRAIRGFTIGGRITDFLPSPGCRIHEPSVQIRAPRLEGRSSGEVLKLAQDNARTTSALLWQYVACPTSCLFINDLTIHLQAGDVGLLLSGIGLSRTFVGNAYSGSSLAPDHGSGLSLREAENLKAVGRAMDIVLNTDQVKRGVEMKRSSTMPE